MLIVGKDTIAGDIFVIESGVCEMNKYAFGKLKWCDFWASCMFGFMAMCCIVLMWISNDWNVFGIIGGFGMIIFVIYVTIKLTLHGVV